MIMSDRKPNKPRPWGVREVEKNLRHILSEEYGGPSLSYSNGQFVIYTWTDAPVGMITLARGHTLEDCVVAYLNWKAREVAKGQRK